MAIAFAYATRNHTKGAVAKAALKLFLIIAVLAALVVGAGHALRL